MKPRFVSRIAFVAYDHPPSGTLHKCRRHIKRQAMRSGTEEQKQQILQLGRRPVAPAASRSRRGTRRWQGGRRSRSSIRPRPARPARHRPASGSPPSAPRPPLSRQPRDLRRPQSSFLRPAPSVRLTDHPMVIEAVMNFGSNVNLMRLRRVGLAGDRASRGRRSGVSPSASNREPLVKADNIVNRSQPRSPSVFSAYWSGLWRRRDRPSLDRNRRGISMIWYALRVKYRQSVPLWPPAGPAVARHQDRPAGPDRPAKLI
jgi:hypothetical protein